MTTLIESDTSSAWADRLIGLLHSQQSLIEQLTPLAQRQGVLISEGRTEALLTVLAERQSIIDRFLATQQGLVDLAGNLPDRLDHLPEARRRQIRHLVRDIDEGLARVMEVDRRDQEQLKSARDQSKDALQGLGTARSAHKAYHAPPSGTNRFADRRG